MGCLLLVGSVMALYGVLLCAESLPCDGLASEMIIPCILCLSIVFAQAALVSRSRRNTHSRASRGKRR